MSKLACNGCTEEGLWAFAHRPRVAFELIGLADCAQADGDCTSQAIITAGMKMVLVRDVIFSLSWQRPIVRIWCWSVCRLQV